MKSYNAKPYTVQAIQFTGDNAQEVTEAVGAIAYTIGDDSVAVYSTLGEIKLQAGQWIVRDGLRTTAMSDDMFRKKFEEADR